MLQRLKAIGPGAMIAAAFIGPGTVTTATIAGGSYGYTLLWAVVFSIVATYILQEMTARLGVVGQIGLGTALRQKIQHPTARLLTAILVITAIFIGNAAYEAGNITGAVMVWSSSNQQFNPLVLPIGLLAFVLLWLGNYKWIERCLVALVGLMGIIFLVAAIAVQPDWGAILQAIFIPQAPPNSLLMIVALIGTTVVPYNLFLHASSVQKRWQSVEDLATARWDIFFSVIVGGLITMAILITTAAAFANHPTSISNPKSLAIGLQPLLGDWSMTFMSLGFLAAGLSSAITAPLAAAFATAEILDWKKDLQATKFRAVWMAVLLAGVTCASLGFKPILVIKTAQIANGLLLPIIALFLLWIANDQQIMKSHTNSSLKNGLGLLIISVTLILGMRGILSALNYL